MCSSMLCRCIYMCGYTHKCVKRLKWVSVFLIAWPSSFSEAGSFIGLELATQLGWLGTVPQRSAYLYLLAQGLQVCIVTPGFVHIRRFWGSNPSPQAYKTNTLETEVSSQAKVYSYMVFERKLAKRFWLRGFGDWVRMLTVATVIWRLSWGWKSCFPSGLFAYTEKVFNSCFRGNIVKIHCTWPLPE